jgi:hypothetical protein
LQKIIIGKKNQRIGGMNGKKLALRMGCDIES